MQMAKQASVSSGEDERQGYDFKANWTTDEVEAVLQSYVRVGLLERQGDGREAIYRPLGGSLITTLERAVEWSSGWIVRVAAFLLSYARRNNLAALSTEDAIRAMEEEKARDKLRQLQMALQMLDVHVVLPPSRKPASSTRH
jgi:predicted transcriptional regulator